MIEQEADVGGTELHEFRRLVARFQDSRIRSAVFDEIEGNEKSREAFRKDANALILIIRDLWDDLDRRERLRMQFRLSLALNEPA